MILVDNAMKFSPEGAPVTVEVSKEGSELVFSVLDRGIGIPPEKVGEIFDRFFQVEDVQHHSKPGLGLGLYIAKEIVDAHGGRIWCEPREGGGTAFRFTLYGPGHRAGNPFSVLKQQPRRPSTGSLDGAALEEQLLKEIRIHGRGGQGNVTLSEFLAEAAFEGGLYAQAFPMFGSERHGAPVTAYVRISDLPIRIRAQIYQPDGLIIQDESLFAAVAWRSRARSPRSWRWASWGLKPTRPAFVRTSSGWAVRRAASRMPSTP